MHLNQGRAVCAALAPPGKGDHSLNATLHVLGRTVRRSAATAVSPPFTGAEVPYPATAVVGVKPLLACLAGFSLPLPVTSSRWCLVERLGGVAGCLLAPALLLSFQDLAYDQRCHLVFSLTPVECKLCRALFINADSTPLIVVSGQGLKNKSRLFYFQQDGRRFKTLKRQASGSLLSFNQPTSAPTDISIRYTTRVTL